MNLSIISTSHQKKSQSIRISKILKNFISEIDNNIKCNIIDIFKLKEIQTFIQIGSSLEYGDLKSPQEEKRKCNPKSWYGLSKLKASKYLKNKEVEMTLQIRELL